MTPLTNVNVILDLIEDQNKKRITIHLYNYATVY